MVAACHLAVLSAGRETPKARYAVDHHVAERAALVDLPHMHGHQRCAKTHCKFIRKPNATNQLKGIINVFHHNSEVGMHHHLHAGPFCCC